MDWFRKLAVRAAAWIHRRDTDAEIADELRLHREERAAELERTGLDAGAARLRAQQDLGSSLRAIEGSRSAWHLGWIEDLASDLRYAARGLLRDRSFAITAVASLALGIGMNTAIFSLAAEFLFSEPSVSRPSSVVYIRVGGSSHAYPEEVRWLRDANALADLAGFREGEMNWRNGDASRRIFSFRVSSNFFLALGVPVAAGRPLQPGDRDAVVLSHRFWKANFLSDLGVLNRSVTLDGRAHTVVGILPEGHRGIAGFGLSPDVYVLADEDRDRLALYGRLPEGMGRGETASRIRLVFSELDRVRPERYYKRTNNLEVAGLMGFERFTSNNLVPIAAFFAMLMLAVDLVLLIACIDVASLLLSRASARQHEIAIRSSIGASRSRIVRQLLAESLLIAVVATGAGIAINLLLTNLMNGIRLPVPVPIFLRIEPDWRLLAYGSAVAVAVALAAGLLPALQAAKLAGPSAVLNRGSRQTGSGTRLRAALVAGQVAVTFVVLACAILFLRNLGRTSALAPGFDTGRVLWASVRLVPARYATPASLEPIMATSLERLRALPGVESASLVRVVPFNDMETRGDEFSVDGSGATSRINRACNRVSPDYFRTMGIPIVAGREFRTGDARQAIAVVNEAFATRVWGSREVVGRRVHFGTNAIEIVGVCRNTKFMTIGEDDRPAMFEPYEAPGGDRMHSLNFMVRAASPSGLRSSVERILLELDPTAAVEAKPMDAAMGFALLPSQLGAGLTGALGLLGLVLASIGLYGVLLYGVERRRREIGVRVALGARLGNVLALVFRDTAKIVGIGMAAGLAVALFVTKPLAMFLVAGLEPGDPVTLIAVGALLAAVAFAASAAPCFRAARIDPANTLRGE